MKSSNSKINKLEISLLEENSRVINNLKKLSVSKSKKEFNESNNVIDVKYTDTTYNDNLYWNEFSSSMEIRINKSNDVHVGKNDDEHVGKNDEPVGKSDEPVGNSTNEHVSNCNDDEHVGNSTNDVIVSNCNDDEYVGICTNDVIVGNCTNEPIGNSTNDVIVSNCNDDEHVGNSTNEPIDICTNEPIGNSTNDVIVGNCTNEPIGNSTNDVIVGKNKVLKNICIECSNVCYRGEGEITNDDSVKIELPYCVKKLYTDLTIQLTPIYNSDKSNITLYTSNIEDNKFTVYATKNVKFYWMVYGKYCNINNEIKDLDLIVNNFL